ncbi:MULTISPECIES: FtsQ-type POTRA domain-containing protein [Paenibacillus]|uniref:Cell division protein DivIB n=2 Tax=Paenibacillus lactis TaxID=228574 RepID=G4HE88_9BACL|nr:FtsQ-type POTRA domain-containing protein [Paenibacillus lactis]EHB65157.1 Polypeptide-transport-associated domain protein FtsQ-type [Paenibacillus lactis 154]MBP1895209.1 cell division protein FtsQ [Paenibacillus lactis]MCM3495554.1 FtsQ-type POTRA domain-containing protein [Paenibacillus lactis]HAF99903.1 cell division protein DivIB [Paenibacillus lactis]
MSNTHIPVLKQDKPKPRAARKIIWILLLLFIALLTILFFRSPISQVSEIQIKGNTLNTKEQLMEQSGLRIGEQYFGVDPDEVKQRLAELGTIKSAEVNKSFPGEISIVITEYPTVAYELSADGDFQAILSSGTSVPVAASGIAVEKPILTKWDPADPNKAKLSQVLAEIPSSMTSDISEIMPSPTLSFPDRIKLYTRSKFEVITSISLLRDKVEYLNQVTELEQPGIITMLEADSYVPFEEEVEEEAPEGE